MRSWALTSRSPLPEADFQRRHRGLLLLLAAQVVLLPIFGLTQGWSVQTSILVCLPAALFGLGAGPHAFGRTGRASCCVLGLLSCSAALVWLWHGQTEAHFHYFVMVGAVALYELAWPYAIAFAFVILQHGLMSAWMPGRVYGSMAGMDHPWLWAGIHGGFIGALALANLVSWRASDRTRGRERAAAMEALQSTRRFERAFAGAPNGAALIDGDGSIADANRALASTLQTTAEALAQKSWFELLPEPEREEAHNAWPPDEDAPEREQRMVRGDGTIAWVMCKHSRLVDHDGVAQWITQTVDITRRRKAEEDLAFQASHDALTGLLNRRAFAAQAQRMLNASDDAIVAILFVDVDDFKIVNDSLGHDAGDELLAAVTQRLSSVTRKGDLLGRFGGDEFVLCLTEPSTEAASATAERISQAVQDPFDLAGVERLVTVSIGLATAQPNERSIRLAPARCRPRDV